MYNPFPYSLDNKRYHTFNYYGKVTYGKKLYKVPLDGPFTCPNRDGSLSHEGCRFCLGGSDAFPQIQNDDLLKQYFRRKEIFDRKWPDGIAMAYFQSYSNTHAPLADLKRIYEPFINNPDIPALVIATRCDCLDKEKIQWLNSLCSIKPIWLELGLQSIHDNTLKEMNRGHCYQDFLNTLELLKKTSLKISVHLINGWPSENREMMIETAKAVGQLPIHAVKFHMLHICKDTPLADDYLKQPFNLLSEEEYVAIVCEQLTWLNKEILIERLTGDALKESLLAPLWTLKKVVVLNDIDKKMAAEHLWQGKSVETQQNGIVSY